MGICHDGICYCLLYIGCGVGARCPSHVISKFYDKGTQPQRIQILGLDMWTHHA